MVRSPVGADLVEVMAAGFMHLFVEPAVIASSLFGQVDGLAAQHHAVERRIENGFLPLRASFDSDSAQSVVPDFPGVVFRFFEVPIRNFRRQVFLCLLHADE